jgi:hypothetical protein
MFNPGSCSLQAAIGLWTLYLPDGVPSLKSLSAIPAGHGLVITTGTVRG